MEQRRVLTRCLLPRRAKEGVALKPPQCCHWRHRLCVHQMISSLGAEPDWMVLLTHVQQSSRSIKKLCDFHLIDAQLGNYTVAAQRGKKNNNWPLWSSCKQTCVLLEAVLFAVLPCRCRPPGRRFLAVGASQATCTLTWPPSMNALAGWRAETAPSRRSQF